jgi:hypothetical protein
VQVQGRQRAGGGWLARRVSCAVRRAFRGGSRPRPWGAPWARGPEPTGA